MKYIKIKATKRTMKEGYALKKKKMNENLRKKEKRRARRCIRKIKG